MRQGRSAVCVTVDTEAKRAPCGLVDGEACSKPGGARGDHGGGGWGDPLQRELNSCCAT